CMSRKPTIIKITKYEKDPSRVGHKLEISSDIIASVKPKKRMKQNKNKHKQTSTRDILLQFMAKVEQFMVKQEQFNSYVSDVLSRNNLK
ncbi:MAG: hypothetical protein LBQ45_00115, partial [Mycoplasmataceae bacterium]|nr:hypothetical protein [Mycoplasmataceae bacterium]